MRFLIGPALRVERAPRDDEWLLVPGSVQRGDLVRAGRRPKIQRALALLAVVAGRVRRSPGGRAG